VLVGLAEIYVGTTVVSRRHKDLAFGWATITILLNALIAPLSLAGLQAEPFWEILDSSGLQVAWSSGLGLLSTRCVCGCLRADVLRDGSGLPEACEAHLRRPPPRGGGESFTFVSASRKSGRSAGRGRGELDAVCPCSVERSGEAAHSLQPRVFFEL
jgi:hypothetical protein